MGSDQEFLEPDPKSSNTKKRDSSKSRSDKELKNSYLKQIDWRCFAPNGHPPLFQTKLKLF